MLLTDILCDSRLVGSCLVQMCRKTGDGMLQVGGWCLSIWFSSRAVPIGGGVPIRQPEGSQIPLDSSVQIPN